MHGADQGSIWAEEKCLSWDELETIGSMKTTRGCNTWPLRQCSWTGRAGSRWGCLSCGDKRHADCCGSSKVIYDLYDHPDEQATHRQVGQHFPDGDQQDGRTTGPSTGATSSSSSPFGRGRLIRLQEDASALYSLRSSESSSRARSIWRFRPLATISILVVVSLEDILAIDELTNQQGCGRDARAPNDAPRWCKCRQVPHHPQASTMDLALCKHLAGLYLQRSSTDPNAKRYN